MRDWTATRTRQLPAPAALPTTPVAAAHPHAMPAMRTAGRWRG